MPPCLRGEVFVTFLILVLAAALRLPGLATNPGWDGDEGYNYNIAWNLAQGHHQMFALVFAFVQHPPLFFAIAAGAFHLFGASMLALRLVSVAFCLGTLALLPLLAREAFADRRAGLLAGRLAALAYAVAPLVVLQNRFGYTYNGLAFWSLLALFALLRARRDGAWRWLLLCGVATSAALSTDQEGVYLLPLLLLGAGRASLGRRIGALAVALSGPVLYIAAMARADSSALLFDVTRTAGRVTGGSLAQQGVMWLYALADLMRFDPLIPLGLAGLALIPYRPARRVVLGLLLLMLLVILKVRDPNPLFRTAEPLLPLVCLGLGVLGAVLWTRFTTEARRGRFTTEARRHGEGHGEDEKGVLQAHWRAASPSPAGGRGGRGVRVAVGLLFIALLVGVAVVSDMRGIAGRFPTRIEGLLPRSTAGAQAMARWVNERVRPTNLVLAMPQVSWQFHARTAEVLQAVAATGQASAFYPAGIPRSRWVYDPRLGSARYLVVDDFTRAWIAQNAPERGLVRRAERTWRLVYHQGEYSIYENPAHAY